MFMGVGQCAAEAYSGSLNLDEAWTVQVLGQLSLSFPFEITGSGITLPRICDSWGKHIIGETVGDKRRFRAQVFRKCLEIKILLVSGQNQVFFFIFVSIQYL